MCNNMVFILNNRRTCSKCNRQPNWMFFERSDRTLQLFWNQASCGWRKRRFWRFTRPSENYWISYFKWRMNSWKKKFLTFRNSDHFKIMAESAHAKRNSNVFVLDREECSLSTEAWTVFNIKLFFFRIKRRFMS